MKSIKIRNLLIALLLLFIVLIVGYKYFEWQTLNNLSNLYNTSWVTEFKDVSTLDKSSDKFFTQYFSYLKEDTNSTDFEKTLEDVGDLKNSLNVVLNNLEGYVDDLKQEKTNYQKLKFRTKVLVGQRGDFARKVIDNQLSYLNYEYSNQTHTLAGLYFLNIFFKNLDPDFINLIEYDNKGQKALSNYNKYFSDISFLEKYTSDNYKFENEELIKKEFPTGYEKLVNYKKYFASYYKVIKDYVNGDYETAGYEYSALKNNSLNIYTDFINIFSSGEEKVNSNQKDILKTVSEQSTLIKNFINKKMYKYPLLSQVNKWKVDLVLCQMYNFKAGLYKSITSDYPKAKNIDDLINEISTLSPKTEATDKNFDRSTVYRFVNDDKVFTFVCLDKLTGEKIEFSTTKY